MTVRIPARHPRPATLPRVRVCAYGGEYLNELERAAEEEEVEWTSGESVQYGDIQVFCISTDVTDAEDVEGSRWRDAVHSIWMALGPMHSVPENARWPRQAPFQLMVLLDTPVPKADLISAGILVVPRWPRGSNGKFLRTEAEIRSLAKVLSRRNPEQHKAINAALGV
jgi:hypothetical protein